MARVGRHIMMRDHLGPEHVGAMQRHCIVSLALGRPKRVLQRLSQGSRAMDPVIEICRARLIRRWVSASFGMRMDANRVRKRSTSSQPPLQRVRGLGRCPLARHLHAKRVIGQAWEGTEAMLASVPANKTAFVSLQSRIARATWPLFQRYSRCRTW